jgi:effector-binding domain-containing protein
MEVAVPVRDPQADQGEVKASTLPAGRALVVIHRGPYDGLKDTWRALGPWMAKEGLVARADPWEEYLDDPCGTPPEDLRTRIVWPIA